MRDVLLLLLLPLGVLFCCSSYYCEEKEKLPSCATVLPYADCCAGAVSGVLDVLLAAAVAAAAAAAALLLLLMVLQRTTAAVLFCCYFSRSSPHGLCRPVICFGAEPRRREYCYPVFCF